MNKNNGNNQNSKYLISAIISFICFIFFTCSIIMRLNGGSSTKIEPKIKGCYYLASSILSGSDTSLCVDGENTVFTYMGKEEATLYNHWVEDTKFDILDEYDKVQFNCIASKEDINKMECTSHTNSLGYNDFIWEK